MKEVNIESLHLNPMTLISDEWMLLTAGTKEGFNSMTCSWGHLGSIWGKYSAVCYVRPQRYTKEFLDREELYTLSFYSSEHKNDMAYIGSHSGRDTDKLAGIALTPAFGEGYTYYQEAKLVLVCRKLYRAPILAEAILDRDIPENYYPEKDYHDMYIGEIVKVLVADDAKFV